MFPDKNLLLKSLSVVVTKCNKKYTIDNFCNSLRKIGKEVPDIKDQLYLLQYIILNKNRIASFPKAKDGQKLEYKNDIIKCIESSEFSELHPVFILTDKAKSSFMK